MILSYQDAEGKEQKVNATIQMAIFNDDGNVINFFSWLAGNYRVISASEKEKKELENLGMIQKT